MKTRIAFCVLAFCTTAMASEPDVAAEIKKTLACHQSYLKSASPFYEVFEREGLTFGRGITTLPNTTPRRSALMLSMTDGDQIYTVTVPSPQSSSRGTIEYDFYGAPHVFKMVVPAKDGEKSFCVSYEPDMIDKDHIRKFEKSPPASCDSSQTIRAQTQTGKDAMMYLRTIQSRIHDNMRAMVYNANAYYNNPAKASRTERDAADRLAQFNGQKCQGLSYEGLFGASIDKQLAEMEKVRARAGTPAAPATTPSGTGGTGTGRR
ncbi:MAG: hypothetical protein KF681_11970 [Bdellovibrionaceae bacterium]|nr:hypothetical protein [Pseudobdellovibrionaceae bacterium]